MNPNDDISVCILGLGYIGLPTAALIAESGYRVIGVDTNAAVIEGLQQGVLHVAEDGLNEVIRSVVTTRKLVFSHEVQVATVIIVCVPTPLEYRHDIGGGKADLSSVYSALDQIAAILIPGSLLIIESTCPVGTTRKAKEYLMSLGIDVSQVDFAYCPERVIPGSIMHELKTNDRIVGGLCARSTTRALEFYKSFVKGEVFGTSAETAELCKLTENSFRDVNIAFANELSMTCSEAGVDVRELIKLANRHPRVNILEPGPGVGGHCIAVDPWFICEGFPNSTHLIKQARVSNDSKKKWTLTSIVAKAGEAAFRNKPICLLGLTYKPDVNDLRESPAYWIALELLGQGQEVVAVEPNLKRVPGVTLINLGSAIESDSLIVGLVAHHEFRQALASSLIPIERFIDFCGLI